MHQVVRSQRQSLLIVGCSAVQVVLIDCDVPELLMDFSIMAVAAMAALYSCSASALSLRSGELRSASANSK